jgi:hypothetical protein
MRDTQGFSFYRTDSTISACPLGARVKADGVPGSDGTALPRLSAGIDRFPSKDVGNPGAGAQVQDQVFIMMDAVWVKVSDFCHIPGDSNVLYMDSHVDFIRYSANAPANHRGALPGYANRQ